MLLWIFAVLAVIGQALDSWTTYYGLYVRKPALAEANTNPINVLLVDHKWALLTVKPAFMVAIFITAAIGQPWPWSGAVATFCVLAGVCAASGLFFGVKNFFLFARS
jgi:hypothetical protein